MASTTPNIGLTLPTGAEKVSRQIINDNNTLIDGKMGAVPVGQNLQGEIDALNGKISNVTFRRKIKTYTNLTLPSGTNPYIKLDDFAGIGISTSKYLVSMLVRGWASIACGTVTLAKGSNGSDIYLMAPQQGTIGSITVEYYYVDAVIDE